MVRHINQQPRPSGPPQPDIQDPAVESPDGRGQVEAKELLDILFEEVLKAFAETDCFSSDSSPNIFLVYAHENPSAGNARTAWAVQLISWLKAVRSKTFSDKSLVPGLWSSREEEDYASVHDVLSNQFCLLPARSRVSKGRKATSVDKVILCCSEVLQSYSEDPRMNGYTNAIKDFYSRAEKEHQDTEAIEEGIQNLVRQHRNDEGFHHVVTELTFLDIRSLQRESRHDIIPVVFNGRDISYLRYFDETQTVWLKVQEHPSKVQQCAALHKLFFKLLRRLYEDQHQSISEFEKFYEDCFKNLLLQGSLPLHDAFMETIRIQKLKAVDQLTRNGYAALRILPKDSSKEPAPWLVPFKRNENFVGREPVILEIDQRLSSKKHCQHVALWGLGGTGKTQIALEYAFRRRDATPGCAIFWVPAIRTDTFETAYLDIGKLLKIPGITDEKADVKQMVKDKLSDERTGEWLIIVDNADDTDVLFKETGAGTSPLIDFLPSSPQGSVLFTTRSRGAAVEQAQAEDNRIRLAEMSNMEAKDLLKKILGEAAVNQEPEEAEELLNLLAQLPLAIIQAASFIAKNGIPLKSYISTFKSSETYTIDMLKKNFEDQHRYRDREMKNPVATTWFISFERIQREDPIAAKYLKFMACLLRESIPQSLLPEVESPADEIQAIGTLTAYSFLTKQDNPQLFDIHRLVHLATRNWLRYQNQLASQTEITLSRVSDVLPYSGYENYNLWPEYLPHAIHIFSSSKEFIGFRERSILLDKVGRCQLILGQYKASEQSQREVLEIRMNELGQKDPSTLMCMSEIGLALTSQGKYTDGEKMHRETLALRQKVLGKEHPETLSSMDYLGRALSKQGKNTEAEKIHEETLILTEKVLGKDHPDTLTSISRLGSIYSMQGKHEEAEKLHRKVLASREKMLGKEHPDTVTSMAWLATILNAQGNHYASEKMYREILSIRDKVSGKEHPHTLAAIDGLCQALNKQGKYKETEKLYRERLALTEKVLGKEHPDVMVILNNLGSVLSHQGRYEEAEKIHREALALRKVVLGSEHHDTLISMKWVNYVVNKRKRLSATSMTRERSSSIEEDIFKSEEHLGRRFGDRYHDQENVNPDRGSELTVPDEQRPPGNRRWNMSLRRKGKN